MDSSIIVIVVLSAVAVGGFIWLEIHSRRNARTQGETETKESGDAGSLRTAREE